VQELLDGQESLRYELRQVKMQAMMGPGLVCLANEGYSYNIINSIKGDHLGLSTNEVYTTERQFE
jgi:hypothetical protein